MADGLRDPRMLWTAGAGLVAIGIAYGTLQSQIDNVRTEFAVEKQEIKASRSAMNEVARTMGELLARIDERTKRIEAQINSNERNR